MIWKQFKFSNNISQKEKHFSKKRPGRFLCQGPAKKEDRLGSMTARIYYKKKLWSYNAQYIAVWGAN